MYTGTRGYFQPPLHDINRGADCVRPAVHRAPYSVPKNLQTIKRASILYIFTMCSTVLYTAAVSIASLITWM